MISWLEKNKKISIIFLTLIAIEIFVLSSISGVGGVNAGINLTSLYYFAVFFLFCFFSLISVFGKEKITKKKLIFVLIISLIYAALDELHQFFVPGRNANINDFLIDSSGIFTSAIIYMCYILNKKKRKILIN